MRQALGSAIGVICTVAFLVMPAEAAAQAGDTYEVTVTTIDRQENDVCFEFTQLGFLNITDSEGTAPFVWSRTNNGKNKKNFLATADAECVNTPNAQSPCAYAIAGKLTRGGKAIKGDILAADFYQATYKGSRVNSCSIVPETPNLSFQGTLAGAGQNGRLEVMIQGAVSRSRFGGTFGAKVELPATAICQLVSGEVVRLFGLFDAGTQELILRGAGYSFEGVVAGQLLSGTYSGPNGASGSFSAVNTQESTATTYCGSYSGDQSGVFNMAVSANGRVVGVWAGGGESGRFTGEVVGTTITISDGFGMATGTIQGNKVSGTWSEGSESGTWTGNTACG